MSPKLQREKQAPIILRTVFTFHCMQGADSHDVNIISVPFPLPTVDITNNIYWLVGLLTCEIFYGIQTLTHFKQKFSEGYLSTLEIKNKFKGFKE